MMKEAEQDGKDDGGGCSRILGCKPQIKQTMSEASLRQPRSTVHCEIEGGIVMSNLTCRKMNLVDTVFVERHPKHTF